MVIGSATRARRERLCGGTCCWHHPTGTIRAPSGVPRYRTRPCERHTHGRGPDGARQRLATVEHASLTRTERLVLRIYLEERRHQATADRLGRALSTIRGHIKSIHGKTGTHSPTDLILFALRHRDCCIGDD